MLTEMRNWHHGSVDISPLRRIYEPSNECYEAVYGSSIGIDNFFYSERTSLELKMNLEFMKTSKSRQNRLSAGLPFLPKISLPH
jgi:hypothetical protein